MKKFPFLFELVITTSLIGLFLIYVNLERYGTYYATKLPHAEGTHPEIVFTLSNLMHSTHPDDASLRYFGGSILGGSKGLIKSGLYSLSISGDVVTITYVNQSEASTVPEYHLSATGQYVKTIYWSRGQKMERNTTEDKDEAYRLAYEAIQPILDVQEAPPNWQNLQWLFNLIYWWRFNIDWFENDQIH